MHNNIAFYLSAMIFIAGVFIIISKKDYFDKIIGLSIFQVGVLIFYISLGKISNASPPITQGIPGIIYSNPLTQVLILTAIVVGFCTLAVGLAFLLQIYKNFGSVNSDDFNE